ncbi:CBF-domain-containing protein [Myriangium duriaei CBS 260.36]|uniref:CBF-domain-containing protein n=1 Tax=Myriangium duriaei CBS 260.36 TaxID=1168546 RepID=A0A9P4IWR5_9PEZI|nr:CBF-domain-containing protein [Myriangium duriaei CBS 260.36]
MPGLIDVQGGKKRKREDNAQFKRRVAKKQETPEDENGVQEQLLELESRITETGHFGAGIKKIHKIFGSKSQAVDERLAAAVALCRIFYRLISGERLVKRKNLSPEERDEVDHLRGSLTLYVDGLCKFLAHEDDHVRSTALTLLMRIVKAEVSQQESRSTQAWKTGAFYSLVRTLITKKNVEGPVQEFLEAFVEEHDDIRFYTFAAIERVLSEQPEEGRRTAATGSLNLLLEIEGIPDSNDQLEDWYGVAPEQLSSTLVLLKAHRKQAQTTWLQVFGSSLDKQQRKQILEVFTERIAPWFSRPETLMDFLTDSYNEGGATSLLALSGVYYLISEKNLDYPQFYQKLYSLLDEGILYSKHRARFFRLLETFLSSTHLPANLVASFIKRLSRLALHAPPGGIVMVVPWVYNMLKKHPQCTFMIHREIRELSEKEELEGSGMDDPFDMSETDPVQTSAIDSSLWELHTLQHHYHPNVATLAKIISEQFTKQEYNVEDFLDHSYNGLIDAELGKDLKKAPVVEFEIPKRIVTKEGGGLNEAGSLLQLAIQAS